jgi:hypothetical protein
VARFDIVPSASTVSSSADLNRLTSSRPWSTITSRRSGASSTLRMASPPLASKVTSCPSADRAPREDRARRRIDRDERATVAERDVRTTGGVDDDAAGLVVLLEHDGRRDLALADVDDIDAVPVGIGGDHRVAVEEDAQRAAADSGGRVDRGACRAELRPGA